MVGEAIMRLVQSNSTGKCHDVYIQRDCFWQGSFDTDYDVFWTIQSCYQRQVLRIATTRHGLLTNIQSLVSRVAKWIHKVCVECPLATEQDKRQSSSTLRSRHTCCSMINAVTVENQCLGFEALVWLNEVAISFSVFIKPAKIKDQPLEYLQVL